jgi:hypothetical protein
MDLDPNQALRYEMGVEQALGKQRAYFLKLAEELEGCTWRMKTENIMAVVDSENAEIE